MTVADLIEILKGEDPDAIVLVEREGEYRELFDSDVRTVLAEQNEDGVETSDGDVAEGALVVLASWS